MTSSGAYTVKKKEMPEVNINLKQAAVTAVAAKPATTTVAIFGATPGVPAIFKSNFDYQLVRGMCAGAYGEGGRLSCTSMSPS
jgi:hypothetical protein